jgi:hypothetical protein
MLNRTPSSRSTFFRLTPTFLTARLTPTAIGLTVALAAALIVAVLVSPTIGPRQSQAGLGSTSISIEHLHGQVDHMKLPIHAVPEP